MARISRMVKQPFKTEQLSAEPKPQALGEREVYSDPPCGANE